MTDEDLIRLARQCLDRPPDFGYYGAHDDLFEVWGIAPVSRHRDSDVLNISNWETVIEDFNRDDQLTNWDVMSASHWGVGWIDQLLIRVLVDESRGVAVDNLTPELHRVAEILDALADYPVLDESDYSEREHADLLHTLEWGYDIAAEDCDAVARELFDRGAGIRADDLDQDQVARAVDALGLRDCETCDDRRAVYYWDGSPVCETCALEGLADDIRRAILIGERPAADDQEGARDALRDLLRRGEVTRIVPGPDAPSQSTSLF